MFSQFSINSSSIVLLRNSMQQDSTFVWSVLKQCWQVFVLVRNCDHATEKFSLIRQSKKLDQKKQISVEFQSINKICYTICYFQHIVRSKQTFEITKIPTELIFCADLGYTSRNKMPKVPIDPMCAKKVIQGQRSKLKVFFYFSRKRQVF